MNLETLLKELMWELSTYWWRLILVLSLRIVAAKTRVSPSLALVVALLLARLVHTIMESLKSEINLLTPICFTDSKVALYWIQGVKKSWKVLVRNKVNEIWKLVPETQ